MVTFEVLSYMSKSQAILQNHCSGVLVETSNLVLVCIMSRCRIPGLPRKVSPRTLEESLAPQRSGNVAAALRLLLLSQRGLTKQPEYALDANPQPMAIYAVAARSLHGIQCPASSRLDEEEREDVPGTSGRGRVQMQPS